MRTNYNASVGGIIARANQRFSNRFRDAYILERRADGLSLREIAQEVGIHFTTVSRILSGKIRSCLTAAQTALTPWVMPKVLRHLTPRNPTLRRLQRRKVRARRDLLPEPVRCCSQWRREFRHARDCPMCGTPTEGHPANDLDWARRELLQRPDLAVGLLEGTGLWELVNA